MAVDGGMLRGRLVPVVVGPVEAILVAHALAVGILEIGEEESEVVLGGGEVGGGR